MARRRVEEPTPRLRCDIPIYEYECLACGRQQELFLKMEHSTPHCSKCLKAMRKKLSRSSFCLKGSGWAKDNYGIRDGQASRGSAGGDSGES
ncbi:FmdB family transcriptional regulator [Candidatus Pacearchaeota archaeon]|nr:FmdB family transcriptional regulator [Candidatus Pacearchaeota archaeon]